ncbi:MAG TPA: YggS family pyridoxal phosphate-dependent enzyme [Saprospiraceae bacterium]|nr:YggS family pyridoxal phosphate-dependent enzyme [Saprospiraceae bacterium]
MPNRTSAYDQLLLTCQPYGASLVAVSKLRSIPEMMVLYDLGQRVFAENKVQEILTKAPLMPADVEWHLIGHLQTNKVKAILPVVRCIQSMDSERLWEKINEEAIKLNKPTDVLLQIKIAQEESKYGWGFDELLKVIQSGLPASWKSVKVKGVMGMATLTDDVQQVRKEMRQLKLYFDQLKSTVYSTLPEFNVISMGMSGDYQVALEEGSNMIRIGTALFE